MCPDTSSTRAAFGQSVAPSGQPAALSNKTAAIRLRSITTVPAAGSEPVPSKTRPPRSTVVPSGPRGPGGAGTRRGSSLVWTSFR